jgi:hypothetical protein
MVEIASGVRPRVRVAAPTTVRCISWGGERVPAVSRRRWLAGLTAVGLLPFTGGALRPEPWPLRRATFEELGDVVTLTVELPGLFPGWDLDALASIDSGFATRVVMEVKLYALRGASPIARVQRECSVQFDLWTKDYAVATRDAAGSTVRRRYPLRADAIVAASTIERLPLMEARSLQRAVAGGRGPYYLATIVAQRNPIAPDPAPTSLPSAAVASATSGGTWFARFVDTLAPPPPEAERTVRLRTNPFYLVPR